MNTIGNLGGAAAGWITGVIVKSYQVSAAGSDAAFKALTEPEKREILWPAYQLNFMIFAGVYVVAVFLWMGVNATKPVAPEAEDGHGES
jgi:hypothetical protein